MAKRQTKAIIKPFASEEINPDFLPSPIGQWAGGGAVTPSLDPEVLLENASQGVTKMCIQQDGQKILPPAGDISAIQYSNDFRITALQEHGIAEYSAVLDYHLNDITKAPSGSKIYRSLINNNIGNPLTDITKWEELDLLALKQATISQRGTLQIATISDINAGTDNTKALTIANLRASNINFTGTPTAPTQPTNDNSTKIATTEFVKNQILTGTFDTIEVRGVWTKTPSYIEIHCFTKIPFDIAGPNQKFFNIPSGIFTAQPILGTVSIYNSGDAVCDYSVGYDAPACTTTTLAIRVTEFSTRGQQAKVSIIAKQIL